MYYSNSGILPGGGNSRPKSSLAKLVAGHLMGQLRRPGRIRNRLLLMLITFAGIVFLALGRRHVTEFQLAATSLKSYAPNRVTDFIARYRADYEDTRWDDDIESKNASSNIVKTPRFHLLIPSSKPTANLCKTLLSAAILNYPPPTLVSYGTPGGSERPGRDLVKNTFNFLLGREAQEDDLILVVEENAWFQLPAEVTINRFFHGMKDSSAKLFEQYGIVKDSNTTTTHGKLPQKYTQRVLFGAAKECSNGANEPACYSVPHSPLPKDIYGHETDKHPEGKYNRPRYMGSSMVMGRVSDLRPIYERASELLEFDDIGKYGSQYVFSKIFGEQEFARSVSAASSTKHSRFPFIFSSHKSGSGIKQPNIALSQDRSYEFGIGLDYQSQIFQSMNNSAEDVYFISFDHPSVIASPSKLSASTFKNPIHLPPDLLLTPPPYSQHVVSSPNPDPPITALDIIPENEDTTWKEVELATNIIVPGSSVPASLNFHGSEALLDQLWTKMWFYKNARALMRRYIRSPDGPIAAKAAMSGGDKWWDLRGGKGGMWTDRGEWLEWNEVCGEFDEQVMGDGKGEFGMESKEVGGQGVVYNGFGQVVGGKEPKLRLKVEEVVEQGEGHKSGGEVKLEKSKSDNEKEGDEEKDEDGDKQNETSD